MNSPTDQPIAPVNGSEALSLSDSLEALLARVKSGPMTLGELLVQLKDRGHGIVIIILSLPFLTPVPLPGLSTVLGLPIAMLGFCELIGIQPWIPGFLRRISLRQNSMIKIVQKMHDWSRKWEGWIRPRFSVMLWPGMKHLIGLNIVLTALFLSLPLPIPGTNMYPAIILVFYAIGLIERDGLCVLIGHALMTIGIGMIIIFFAVIALAISEVWHHFV